MKCSEIKEFELHCKWRLVVPSASWCQKCFVNLISSCNAQDYFFWLTFQSAVAEVKRSEAVKLNSLINCTNSEFHRQARG